MNREIIRQIDKLRAEGHAPTAIANALGISRNTVKSHIHRHPEIPGMVRCQCCGRYVPQSEGRKVKLYCSDQCRVAYWNRRRREEQNEQ